MCFEKYKWNTEYRGDFRAVLLYFGKSNGCWISLSRALDRQNQINEHKNQWEKNGK